MGCSDEGAGLKRIELEPPDVAYRGAGQLRRKGDARDVALVLFGWRVVNEHRETEANGWVAAEQVAEHRLKPCAMRRWACIKTFADVGVRSAGEPVLQELEAADRVEVFEIAVKLLL